MRVYKPINGCIDFPDASIDEFAYNSGMHDINYDRSQVFADTINFDRTELDYDLPIKAFSGNFFEELSEFLSIDNIKEIYFQHIQFEDNIGEEFFQPIKNSLRRIQFEDCTLNELPEYLFKDLCLESLIFMSNTFSNFNTPLTCKGLKSTNRYMFAFNEEKSSTVHNLTEDRKIYELKIDRSIHRTHFSLKRNTPPTEWETDIE